MAKEDKSLGVDYYRIKDFRESVHPDHHAFRKDRAH